MWRVRETGLFSNDLNMTFRVGQGMSTWGEPAHWVEESWAVDMEFICTDTPGTLGLPVELFLLTRLDRTFCLLFVVMMVTT